MELGLLGAYLTWAWPGLCPFAPGKDVHGQLPWQGQGTHPRDLTQGSFCCRLGAQPPHYAHSVPAWALATCLAYVDWWCVCVGEVVFHVMFRAKSSDPFFMPLERNVHSSSQCCRKVGQTQIPREVGKGLARQMIVKRAVVILVLLWKNKTYPPYQHSRSFPLNPGGTKEKKRQRSPQCRVVTAPWLLSECWVQESLPSTSRMLLA